MEDEDLFPVSIFFLKVIIKNEILPDGQPLAMSCIKSISNYFRFNNINVFAFQKKVPLAEGEGSRMMIEKENE